MNRYNVGILGTGSYLPEQILTNKDLESFVDTSDEWISTRTGIRERRVCKPDEAASDLATKAAEHALASAGISAEELDLIVVATMSPDMMMPSTANLVQHRIGAKKAASFDLTAACTGFVYALTTASQFIQTGFYRRVLVIGVECVSRMLNWNDRNTCVLFGDGAGAVVLGRVEEGTGFLSFELGSDGSGWQCLQLPAGGSRIPLTEESVRAGQHTMSMAGAEVFKFAVKILGQTVEAALVKAQLTKEDIDLLIPHQANVRIIDSALKRLNLPMEKVVVNLDRYANTSAASIPIALDEAVRDGRVHNGDTLVFVGFGGGLTWGATVLKWNTNEKEM